MQILVRTVQNCAADRGDLTGTVLGMVLDAHVVVQQQVRWLETVEVPQLPFFWGSRMHHPRWLLEEFYDFFT